MLRKINRCFKNFRFQKKIALISILSSIIPLILLTFVGVYIIQAFIQQQEKSAYSDNLKSISYQLESKIHTYRDSLLFLANNTALTQELSSQHFSNFDQYYLFQNTIVPLFHSVRFPQADITGITLYTTIDLYNHGQYVKKITSDTMLPFFGERPSTEIRTYFDEEREELSFYTNLFLKDHTADSLNYIVLTIDRAALFNNLDAVTEEPYDLTIQSETGQILYHSDGLTNQQIRQKQLLVGSAIIEEEPVLLTNHWQVVFVKTAQSFFSSLLYLVSAALIIFVFVLVILILSSWWLAKTVVQPINSLTQQMASLSMDQLKIQHTYSSRDEIGQLYNNFQKMLDKIAELITEVYEAEGKQKKYELRALQAQINPHFFYNSLALISNTATLSGNQEIQEMAQLLSRFYRLSLNQGSSGLSARKELDLTITYAKIQQKMHHHSFDLVLEIDPDLDEYPMINLLLQPFVENAVFHGIDHIEDSRRGILTIRCLKDDHRLRFEIQDNGPGISPEQLKQLEQPSDKHYGISNVRQRLALYYGDQASLSIQSEKGQGTKVILLLPSALPQKQNPLVKNT
ncbi:histidine kinase [Enterococcus sp.]|uniref:sensor histidine kinase n=1 Tax=Enterococcus sp. TaxID=35783 RepID=UPI0025BFF256|nr:histidine kinase [Enterococcus sp.]